MDRIRWDYIRSDDNESDGIKWYQMASDYIWDQKRSYYIRLYQMSSDSTKLSTDEIRSNYIEWN